MDTRRRRDQAEGGSKPEVSTDTVPVELVELRQVGPRGRGVGRKAFVALTAVGVVVIAVLLANGRPAHPTPSPSAPLIGLATTQPTLSVATPTTRPSQFRSTPAPPTAEPTAPPPWQWTRSDFLPDLNPSLEGTWAVNGRVLSLIRRIDANGDLETWSLASLGESNAWEVLPAPPAIIGLSAGTVIDGRLWFFAQVGGVTAADTTWRLVSTADGASWESLGAADGLPPFDGASLLARTNGTWVIVTEGNQGVGASNAAISWSADGQHWKAADVPQLRANVGFTQMASIGGAVVILGFDFDSPEATTWIVLRSTDGRTWRQSSFKSPLSRSPRDLACGDHVCLITLEPFDLISSTQQALMMSADGDSWAEVDSNVPYTSADSIIRLVTPTATGFIAMTGYSGQALLSTDGVAWRTLDVLPPGAPDLISELAIAGDVVVAMAPRQSSEEPNRFWVGSLATMGN
jgi:hypothetical protein